MKEYINLLKDISAKGTEQENRTGINTSAIFDYSMKIDLSKGFPLLTTKEVNFDTIKAELLMFMQGIPDRRDMQIYKFGKFSETRKDIWYYNCVDAHEKNPVKFDGYTLGNMYPVYWRRRYNPSTEIKEIPIKYPKDQYTVDPSDIVERGVYGTDVNKTFSTESLSTLKQDKIHFLIINLWKNIHNGEFNVNERWNDFKMFQSDIRSLPCFNLYINDPTNYVLNCTYHGSNTHSRHTTIFIHKNELEELNKIYSADTNTSQEILLVNDYFKFFTISDAKAVFGNDGFFENNSIEYIKAKEGHIFRREKFIDQLQVQIDNIKECIKDPTNSAKRRLIIDAWNPSWSDDSVLGICHPWMQFVIEGSKLSLKFIMRSSDVFLGLPFNIASYALLLHSVAILTGLEVGSLVYSGNDVHIYKNHFDAIEEQLKRNIRKLPVLKVNNDINCIDDITFDTFTIEKYNPHPIIKAPMAV